MTTDLDIYIPVAPQPPSRASRPHTYWNDVANLERELRAFIADHDLPNVMPTARDLRAAKQFGIITAIRRAGGFAAAAAHLGLPRAHTYRSPRPRNYWEDLTNLGRELYIVIASHGTSGVMPNNAILEAAQRADLIRAVRLHGGMDAVAARLGLARPHAPREKGYWQDFTHLERELRTYIAAHGTPGVMPTYNELEAAGQLILARAIRDHGGWATVTERLGLRRPHTRRPSGYWDDFANLERELRAYLAEHGVNGIMPTSRSLEATEHRELSGAILLHGGFLTVATRLGLSRPNDRKPQGYWQEFVNLERELRAFMDRSGINGQMPTRRELEDAGAGRLIQPIARHGGFPALAARLGLAYVGPQPAARHAARAAQVERALQPLAQARLVSSAHLLVLLRRTGLLTSRDARIARLREGLVANDAELIEAALGDLLSAGAIDPPLLADAPTADEQVADDLGWDEPDEEPASLGETAGTDDLNNPAPQREWLALQGLVGLDTLRLPLDPVLRILTTRVLWNAFYRRLYAWYEHRDMAQPVTPSEVEAIVIEPYAAAITAGLVADAIGAFVAAIVEAVNLATTLAAHGWRGPRLRLHQAEALRQLVTTLRDPRDDSFLLVADDPGMGKTISLLAAVCLASARTTLIVAPKTVADDTWMREIARCLPDAHIIRGLPAVPDALPSDGRVFIVAHYDELLNIRPTV